MDITYQDYFQKNQFDYTFLQFFGKLEKQSKTNDFNVLKFQDNLVKTKGKRCQFGVIYYKGVQKQILEQTQISLIDILNSLFEIEQRQIGILNVTIKDAFKETGSLLKQCLYNELFLRLYRDLTQHSKFNPQFWFFNSEETKLHYDPKFSYNNEIIQLLTKKMDSLEDTYIDVSKTCKKEEPIYLLISEKNKKITLDIRCDLNLGDNNLLVSNKIVKEDNNFINFFNYP